MIVKILNGTTLAIFAKETILESTNARQSLESYNFLKFGIMASTASVNIASFLMRKKKKKKPAACILNSFKKQHSNYIG